MLDVELLHLKDLPDEAVLTERQAARLLNISIDTLKRLDQSHEGPPLVWLSPRRKGRPHRSSPLAREARSRLNPKRPAMWAGRFIVTAWGELRPLWIGRI